MTETNNNDTSFPRSRVKKQSNRVLYLFIITITLLTGGFYFYQKNLKSLQEEPQAAMAIPNPTSEPYSLSNDQVLTLTDNETSRKTDIATTVSKEQSASHMGEPLPIVSSSDFPATEPSSFNKKTRQDAFTSTENEPLDTVITAAPNQAPNVFNYQAQIAQLNSFYDHLDSQQYMQDFRLSEPSKTHFSKLIQKLIENPPVVTRETDDLFTLLKNTAHFFRIIGKDNILVLKGILDREKDSFESILQSLYILTSKPEILKNEYSVTLDQEALYDYACFFLNTMGGRLYLFRRDSNSRMAVSFYAIAIIDRANETGHSRHGIDIRPGIDSLIEEIENGGNNLDMREYYLDRLYDLKVKYD